MADLKNYRSFVDAGYSWTELALNFFRLKIYSRISTALKHAFAYRGHDVVIDYTVYVQGARFISIGDGSWIQRHAHLSVPLIEMESVPTGTPLRIGKRVQIGEGCFFAAANKVEIADDALFGPNVYIADHTHAYEDPLISIRDQGLSNYGRVCIGKGAWIGINVVIIAINKKEISIGAGAVVSANSVVTRSVAPKTMVAGIPARVIKKYDEHLGQWHAVTE
jgi:acetyltransferase-like isoleucine patch superfamily enzyme